MKIKVDYKKKSDKNGYVYTQTITISKAMASLFNKDLMIYKALHKSNENDLFLQQLKYGINYLTLTTARRFKDYIAYNWHENLKRIKDDRNTIIIVR